MGSQLIQSIHVFRMPLGSQLMNIFSPVLHSIAGLLADGHIIIPVVQSTTGLLVDRYVSSSCPKHHRTLGSIEIIALITGL